MHHTIRRSCLGSLFGLMIAVVLVSAQAQVMQIELPLEPGRQMAALTQLKTILTNMGGQLHMDAPQAGHVGAMFPGGHQILANAWQGPQGRTGIVLTCSGDNLAQAQERCNTVKRQYRP